MAAIDFSRTSEDAVRTACILARACRRQLHLVHVVTDVTRRARWTSDAESLNPRELQSQWFDQAQRRLGDVATGALPDDVAVIRRVLVGQPEEEIPRYVREYHAHLIVLGTHGYGPVRRLLLGSVAENVIRHASCPVLSVPHRELWEPDVKALASTAVTPAGQR